MTTPQRSSNHQPLIAVVAMTPSGVIGRDGDMPWRLGSDLRRFKKMTMGGTLLMGRKTFDSIGRGLPGRRTIVITRSDDWMPPKNSDGPQVDRAGSPQAAVEMARIDPPVPVKPIFVVGGAEIYRQLIDDCQELWLTRVWSDATGDTELEIDLSKFRVIEQTRIPASQRDEVPTEFLRLASTRKIPEKS